MADLFCLIGLATFIIPLCMFLHIHVKICFFLLTSINLIFALLCISITCSSLGSLIPKQHLMALFCNICNSCKSLSFVEDRKILP